MGKSVNRRVLMLLENAPYPQDPRVLHEATALAAAGNQISVICPSVARQPWREILDGVRVYRFPAPLAGNSFLGYLWEYGYSMAAIFVLSLLLFFRKGFDVLHVHNPPDTFVFIAAFYKLLGKRFVYDHHDLIPELYYARFGDSSNRLIYRALVWLERLSCQLADHVITANQSHKTIEMQRGRVPEEYITIVRNGPDLNRMQTVAPDPDLRQKGKTISSFGDQEPTDIVFEAASHLPDVDSHFTEDPRGLPQHVLARNLTTVT